jgi:hypothetical protein
MSALENLRVVRLERGAGESEGKRDVLHVRDLATLALGRRRRCRSLSSLPSSFCRWEGGVGGRCREWSQDAKQPRFYVPSAEGIRRRCSIRRRCR